MAYIDSGRSAHLGRGLRQPDPNRKSLKRPGKPPGVNMPDGTAIPADELAVYFSTGRSALGDHFAHCSARVQAELPLVEWKVVNDWLRRNRTIVGDALRN